MINIDPFKVDYLQFHMFSEASLNALIDLYCEEFDKKKENLIFQDFFSVSEKKMKNDNIFHVKKKLKLKEKKEIWEVSFFGEISNRIWKNKIESLYEKGNLYIVRIDLKSLDKKRCSNEDLEILFENYYFKYRSVDPLERYSSRTGITIYQKYKHGDQRLYYYLDQDEISFELEIKNRNFCMQLNDLLKNKKRPEIEKLCTEEITNQIKELKTHEITKSLKEKIEVDRLILSTDSINAIDPLSKYEKLQEKPCYEELKKVGNDHELKNYDNLNYLFKNEGIFVFMFLYIVWKKQKKSIIKFSLEDYWNIFNYDIKLEEKRTFERNLLEVFNMAFLMKKSKKLKLSRLIISYEKQYGKKYLVHLNPEIFEELEIKTSYLNLQELKEIWENLKTKNLGNLKNVMLVSLNLVTTIEGNRNHFLHPIPVNNQTKKRFWLIIENTLSLLKAKKKLESYKKDGNKVIVKREEKELTINFSSDSNN